MNIVLSGMMGSGKTSVAAEFEKLGYVVVDIDSEITAKYGAIDAIFAEHGEEHFRNLETQVTREAAEKYENAVISLGGGCVLRQENVKNLKQTGKIFYLRAECKTLIERLKGDTTRPLLKGGLEAKVTSILAARSAIYEETADFIIDTDGLTPLQIAKRIEGIIL